MNTTLRKTIKTIDNRFLAGALTKFNFKYKTYNNTNKMHAIFKYNNNVCITMKKQNYLGGLFDKYGSDKGCFLYDSKYKITGSSFNDIYELLFFQHKEKTKLVLECGIGTKNSNITSNMSNCKHSIPGGSLRAWRDYFHNAHIIGIDIDPSIIFTEKRINTYLCDQTSKQSINNFIRKANLQSNSVDIIIDDGLHEFNANIMLFENTKYLLKDNGIYVIEDFWITNKEQHKFIAYFSNLDGYDVKFIKHHMSYLIVITNKYYLNNI